MFTHVVLFKLRESDEENVKKARNILLSMRGNIPELKYIEVGVDVLHTDRSYDLALITRFSSEDDMERYQTCDYHVNGVLKNLRPMLESSVALDY